jgi:16S rRNA (guanine527-N7)-methyltransferase
VEIQRAIEKGLDYFNIQYNDEILIKLCFYIEELGKWNEHINLTGIKSPPSIVEILLYDAFFMFSRVKENRAILDMGSGSGILAVPIKILGETYESQKVFSVDKSLKKIQFQRHIKRSLNLKGFTPVQGRIEMLEPIGVDALVAKGFGTAGEIIESGGRHLKQGGRAFIVKGKNEAPQDIADFYLEEDTLYSLPESDRIYRLFIYQKV